MSIDPTEVPDSGPLGAFSIAYANELARQGYAPASVRMQLKVLADLSNWLLHQGMIAGDLKAVEVDRFLCSRRAAGHTRYVSAKAVSPILDYLRRLEIVPPEAEGHGGPVEMMLCRYWRFLTVERSLAHVTARICPSLTQKSVTMHVLRHSAAMRLLRARIDTSVIALWLGHEQIETTQVYLHADLEIKERALAKTVQAETKPGRFRPADKLLAFLEAL